MNGLPCSSSFVIPTSAEAPNGYCVMQFSEDLQAWSCIDDHCNAGFNGDPHDPSLPLHPFDKMCQAVPCRDVERSPRRGTDAP